MSVLIYVITGIILVFLVLVILAPKGYEVSRSVVIERTKPEVYHHLKYLKNQDSWSPWAKKDPQMKKGFVGEDGSIGAISSWDGNKEVGAGEQEITALSKNERIESKLRFLKPWKSESDCYFQLHEEGEGKTKVTWGFTGENAFPMNIMMLFMSMDKMVGNDFEQGLESLKRHLES